MTVWRWKFNSHEELQRALEEYCSFADGTKVAHYGERIGGGEDDSPGDKHTCVMRRNAEIDLRMDVLKPKTLLLWTVLDGYYRRGWCMEAKGWQVVAKAVGMPHENRHQRLHFEELVTIAVAELFHARPVAKDGHQEVVTVPLVDKSGNLC